jgi:5'-nucleotidase
MTWEHGDWMVTASGVQAYPAAPERTEIRIFDIAHALGRICRFGGHVRVAHYSVAQHSILVSRIVPPPMALAGLLHDAAEAYIGDIVKPFKGALWYVAEPPLDLAPIAELEARWYARIAATFGLPSTMPPEIKAADMTALWTERRDVMAPNPSVPVGTPLEARIKPLCSKRATAAFLARFEELIK